MQSYGQKKLPARKKRSVKGSVKETPFLLRIRKTKVGGFCYHIVATKLLVTHSACLPVGESAAVGVPLAGRYVLLARLRGLRGILAHEAAKLRVSQSDALLLGQHVEGRPVALAGDQRSAGADGLGQALRGLRRVGAHQLGQHLFVIVEQGADGRCGRVQQLLAMV